MFLPSSGLVIPLLYRLYLYVDEFGFFEHVCGNSIDQILSCLVFCLFIITTGQSLASRIPFSVLMGSCYGNVTCQTSWHMTIDTYLMGFWLEKWRFAARYWVLQIWLAQMVVSWGQQYCTSCFHSLRPASVQLSHCHVIMQRSNDDINGDQAFVNIYRLWWKKKVSLHSFSWCRIPAAFTQNLKHLQASLSCGVLFRFLIFKGGFQESPWEKRISTWTMFVITGLHDRLTVIVDGHGLFEIRFKLKFSSMINMGSLKHHLLIS